MAHRDARLNVHGRELLARRVIESCWSVSAAARAVGEGSMAIAFARQYLRECETRVEGAQGD
jgi:hypothetical protein